jgi:hypothetical protein
LKLQKAEILFNMRDEDAKYHQSISQEITVEINKSKAEMSQLQKELEDQKRLKAQKAEYEIIAKSINTYPPQDDMERKIHSLTIEKEEFEKKSKGDEILLK